MRSSSVMDLNNIPACALYRHIGTVIVRMKMEVSSVICCQRGECPSSRCPHSIHKPSGCEQCPRTSLISQYSDCDSDLVDKCRPYRSSAARSRYVNVCAAVCLLLLVGGLSPQSSAAPHRNRSAMDRQRRAADSTEYYLWGNPCDLSNPDTEKVPDPKEKSQKLVIQANAAYSKTAEYKNAFAMTLHSYQSFDELISKWDGDDWLRKFQLSEEVLPKEKILYKEMPDEYMDKLMKNIDNVLPSMYKALKLVVAGLYSFSKDGLNDSIVSYEILRGNITQTMHDVRAVLCYFNGIMKGRKLEILPLPDSEIPVFKPSMLTEGLLLYRDTLNYLEYLAQVFKKLYGTDSA